MEQWKDLNSLYEVSDLGRVKSKAIKKYDAGGRTYSKKERILKPSTRSDGYYFLNVSQFRHRRTWKVHQLVAHVFIPNPNNYNCINHINGNKTDNRAVNLEWCSDQYNTKHGFEVLGNQANNVQYGAANPSSKKVKDTASGVVYETISSAADAIGMNSNTLRAMLSGRNRNKTTLELYESTD